MEKVIFDTNAYLDLIDSVPEMDIDSFMNDVRDKETLHGITSLLHPVVMKEILSHLYNNSNAKRRLLYLKANKAMYLHCRYAGVHNIAASVELLLAKNYWNKPLPHYEESSKAILQVSELLAKAFPQFPTQLPQNLKKIHDMIELGEQGFVNAIQNFLKTIDPYFDGVHVFKADKNKRKAVWQSLSTNNMDLYTAMSFIMITQSLLYYEKQIPNEQSFDELKDKGEMLIKECPEAIYLQKWIYEQCFSTNGFNIFKHRNFVWDMHLMFYAGFHKINGAPLIFVTSDKAMLDAVNAINPANNTVINIATYRQKINI